MRLHLRVNFFLLCLAMLLGGCSFASSRATPTVERITFTPPERIPPTNTPTLRPPQPTATETSTPTLSRKLARLTRQAQTSTPTRVILKATSTPSQPPVNILKLRSFEVVTRIPTDVKLTGTLLVLGKQPQILYLDSQPRVEDFSAIDTTCLSTSPDGKWVAYCPVGSDSPTGRWLMVESSDQQQQYEVAMDMYLISFGEYEWLDNQHLIFPMVRSSEKFNPMVVFNPFSGEQSELASNYPGIVGSNTGSAGTMSFAYGDVAYDPSLNLVVFSEQRDSHKYIALWNRESSSILAEVEDIGKFLHYPLWSPDAKQFAVAARQKGKLGHNVEEWYLVSREGQVEQLTHFGDYFRVVTIGANANWSPDGQKLAFWFNTLPDTCPGVHLAVLEMGTRQVTDTCIPGTFGFSKPPLWSLDSQYIVLRYAGASSSQMLLVDFAQGRAFDITEYGVPVGWLDVP